MRRDRLYTALGLSLAGALLAGLAACGGAKRLTLAPGPGAAQPATPVAAPPAAANPARPRNLLRVTTPALAGLTPGSTFDVTLSATTVEPLFQASARLLFDPAPLEPVSAAAGQLGADYITLTRADAALRMNGAGYVPFACTGPPGSSGLAPATRTLLTVRFRVKQALSSNAGLHLLSDQAYLQLRGPDNRRLSFDLSEEVAAR